MATIQKRNNSYKITVSCGYDMNKRQIRKTMTWKPEPNMNEKQIEEIKSRARTGKNEVNGIGKLELIDFAIKNKLDLRFKLYNGESFSERIIDIPISWNVSAGDLVVQFANGEYKLSQIIDLRAEKNDF